MITAHHIAASTQCHEFYSAGYLGTRPLTSSIGYPMALAERTSDLPNAVSSRPNSPRPKLQSIRAPLHQYICGIERLYPPMPGGRFVVGVDGVGLIGHSVRCLVRLLDWVHGRATSFQSEVQRCFESPTKTNSSTLGSGDVTPIERRARLIASSPESGVGGNGIPFPKEIAA